MKFNFGTNGFGNALPEICLVMIVRDEAHVIERCLASVRPMIRRWCIVDTGSKDDTPAIIQRTLADLDGGLHHREWVDFGHNRSEAMRLAFGMGEWLLLIDADEELSIDADFHWPERSDVDAWQIRQRMSGGTEFDLPRLLRADRRWFFEGVLHESLACDSPFRQAVLPGLSQWGHFDSARNQRSKRDKYLADAALLRKALNDEPGNTRYQFYLAQSLRDAGEIDSALEAYRKRIAMGGWEEEVFYSLFEVARLLEQRGAPHADVGQAYLSAWNRRPGRSEPLVELARIHRQKGEHALAHLFARRAFEIPRPDDVLFVDATVYAWRAQDELSVACYWMGESDRAAQLAGDLLASGRLPASELERVRRNLDLFHGAR